MVTVENTMQQALGSRWRLLSMWMTIASLWCFRPRPPFGVIRFPTMPLVYVQISLPIVCVVRYWMNSMKMNYIDKIVCLNDLKFLDTITPLTLSLRRCNLPSWKNQGWSLMNGDFFETFLPKQLKCPQMHSCSRCMGYSSHTTAFVSKSLARLLKTSGVQSAQHGMMSCPWVALHWCTAWSHKTVFDFPRSKWLSKSSHSG